MSVVDLQSRDHRDLLDIIDKLREQGITKYVDLPQIIVVGDQSSGKSSVLEAISKMSFPAKDNLCTRFATELILRRDISESIKISIIAGPDRSAEEKMRLAAWSLNTANGVDLGEAVEKAREAMGICESKVFATDILRVELSGPGQPHLTLVDLPGIFRAGNRDQTVKDAAVVRKLVTDYMKKERSIIVAVVSAKSDFALQEITQMARELDPNGKRTLGLITKPDTLDRGSESEEQYFKLIKNEDVRFRLGWHVLKNRSFATKDHTSEERDADEEDFFSSGIWHGADPKILGVKSLVPRLSNVLKDQILLQLPGLTKDINASLKVCDKKLAKLGIPRGSTHDQRQYLLRVSHAFTEIMTAAVKGSYDHAFFGRALLDEGYERRLRAVVQNVFIAFDQEMEKNGQSQIIRDSSHDSSTVVLSKNEVSRADYVKQVQLLMKRSRGCELPGTFNPQVIGELFTEQCRPWKKIAAQVKKKIIEAVSQLIDALLEYTTVDETSSAIHSVIGDGLERLKKSLDDKIVELLQPHLHGHPITYNHYLTDNVQKIQAARHKKDLTKVLQQWADVHSPSVAPQGFGQGAPKTPFPTALLNMLEQQTQKDMQVFAAETAIDYMQAFYKVARKKFVDDISVLAVEQCLMAKLPDLFSPKIIHGFSKEQIADLAGESQDNSEERNRLSEQRSVLRDALVTLKRLDKHKGALFEESGDADAMDIDEEEDYEDEEYPDEEEEEEEQGEEAEPHSGAENGAYYLQTNGRPTLGERVAARKRSKVVVDLE